MPEIRIGRIIIRLTIPSMVLIPITSTTGMKEIAKDKDMRSNRDRLSVFIRPEEASA
jgi:hypothetical protein